MEYAKQKYTNNAKFHLFILLVYIIGLNISPEGNAKFKLDHSDAFTWMQINIGITAFMVLFNFLVSRTLTTGGYKFLKFFDLWYAVSMTIFLYWGLKMLLFGVFKAEDLDYT